MRVAVVVCVALGIVVSAKRASTAGDKPPADKADKPSGDKPDKPPLLVAGDVRVEIKTRGTDKWLVTRKEPEAPLGLAPGNLRLRLETAKEIELVFSRENASSVVATLLLDKNGTISLKNTYECNDSFTYDIKVASISHVIVSITVGTAPMSCSGAFATSRSRYGLTYRASKGSGRELFVIYDASQGLFHRFAMADNAATVSLPATIDHVFVMRAPSHFDCAKKVAYVFKNGGMVQVDGKDIVINVDAPAGTEAPSIDCEMVPLVPTPKRPDPKPPATTPNNQF